LEQKILCKIYELKGLIKGLSDISEREEDYYHPMIDSLTSSMNELIVIIEGVKE